MEKIRGLLKIIGIMLLTLGLGITTVAAKELSKEEEEINTFLGILIDAHCSGTKTPEKHPKACSLMPECAKSGYGIDVQQADGSIQFYRFDDKGQELAKAYLNNTQKENQLAVIVEGSLNNEEIRVATLQEDASGAYETYKLNLTKEIELGKSLIEIKENIVLGYSSFYRAYCKLIDCLGNVTAIEGKLENVYEGILQDQHCFGKVSPEIDTKMCLTMEECAASGYGLVIKDANGQNTFYTFDIVGNEKAKQILSSTTKDSHITIKVSGELVGQIIKVQSIEEIK